MQKSTAGGCLFREGRFTWCAAQRVKAYLKVSDRPIEEASKEEIAEVARVRALHLAHYRAKHGEMLEIRQARDLHNLLCDCP